MYRKTSWECTLASKPVPAKIDGVIQSGAALQAQPWISYSTGPSREPTHP